MTDQEHSGRFDGLALSIALAIMFVLASMLRLAGDSQSIVSSQSALQSVLSGSILQTKLAWSIAVFVLAHTFLALLLGFLCWTLALASRMSWRATRFSRKEWIFIWSILASFQVLISNAALYPWSLLGEPYSKVVTAELSGITLFNASSILILGFAVISCMRASWVLVSLVNKSRDLRKAIGGISLVVFAATVLIALNQSKATPSSSDRPNVVIIGIDALRHDVPFGGMGEDLTPTIDKFLSNSVRFTDAITPLARTFPSWVSTLTGRHPHTTGAVMNLLPRDLICTGETLPETLRRSGYQTIYAIDEVRFSNIDSSYGFDKLVTPPIGASDFLLGSLNDTPLSNLISNTRLGQWLFPHSYGNRGSAVTYNPHTFVDWFERELTDERPLFIAAHLTLAHWPYYWATAPQRELKDTASLQKLYEMSIMEVDEQLSRVLAALRRARVLDNAIVILMSDHGEAIGKAHDNPYASDNPQLLGLIRLGHGTSVLSPQQYRVVLGIRSFGNGSTVLSTPQTVDAPVMLTDLAPTIVDALRISSGERYDGLSLLDLLTGPEAAINEFEDRVRFTETEFNPRGFQPGVTLTASALSEIATFYELDPESDRIVVKRDRLERLLNDRQYAAISGNRLVAAVPGPAGAGFRFIAADRNGGRPMEVAPFAGRTDPKTRSLMTALVRRYGRALDPEHTPASDVSCNQ